MHGPRYGLYGLIWLGISGLLGYSIYREAQRANQPRTQPAVSIENVFSLFLIVAFILIVIGSLIVRLAGYV
jgi:hypothetical protein